MQLIFQRSITDDVKQTDRWSANSTSRTRKHNVLNNGKYTNGFISGRLVILQIQDECEGFQVIEKNLQVQPESVKIAKESKLNISIEKNVSVFITFIQQTSLVNLSYRVFS